MKVNHIHTQKRIAIITNNLHCERHFQYFSTIEKYFRLNGWVIAGDFNVNKIIICGCGFHDAMYEKVTRTLEKIKSINFLEKNIIIMACLTRTHEVDLKRKFKGYIIEFHQEELLDDIIDANIPFKQVKPVNKFNVHKKCRLKNSNKNRFYIKISQGCLRQCTFCVINKAKGFIKSVPFAEIREQVQKAIEDDRKEIFLMGEDTFAYGIDIGTNIIELVEKLTADYLGIELYFGYLHIRWLKKYAKEIMSLCKRKILKELHIGLQHVNDEMLKRMGRPAVFSEIYDIIRTIKKECPHIYMVADILVGFPGENDEIFNELVAFFKKDQCFNKVKHFGYSDVKGAPSTYFENKVPDDEIAIRWNDLNEILGERSYSVQDQEKRIDNETFRITRFDDYFFCIDTFDETIREKGMPWELEVSNSNILENDKGDFNFSDNLLKRRMR